MIRTDTLMDRERAGKTGKAVLKQVINFECKIADKNNTSRHKATKQVRVWFNIRCCSYKKRQGLQSNYKHTTLLLVQHNMHKTCTSRTWSLRIEHVKFSLETNHSRPPYVTILKGNRHSACVCPLDTLHRRSQSLALETIFGVELNDCYLTHFKSSTFHHPTTPPWCYVYIYQNQEQKLQINTLVGCTQKQMRAHQCVVGSQSGLGNQIVLWRVLSVQADDVLPLAKMGERDLQAWQLLLMLLQHEPIPSKTPAQIWDQKITKPGILVCIILLQAYHYKRIQNLFKGPELHWDWTFQINF